MRVLALVILLSSLVAAATAFAEESEFKGKLQEDMDGYIAQIKSSCDITVTTAWTGGKLGFNPRETKDGNYSGVSTLCTSGMDALAQACNNGPVKKAMKGIKKVACTDGKGTITFSKKGDTATIKVDPKFDKNNAAGQTADLVEKLKKELDT